MNYLKAAMATTALLIAGLVGFMFITFDADYQYEQAMEAFQKGQVTTAAELIDDLDDGRSSPNHLLYLSYIKRAEGDTQAAQELLSLAEAQLKKRSPVQLQMEIVLGKALNGVILEDSQMLEAALIKGRELEADQSWVVYFDALLQQWNGDHAAALKAWGDEESADYSSQLKKNLLSGWMQAAFSQEVNAEWRRLQRARSHLVVGDYLSARRLLESLLHTKSNIDRDQCHFLLGLSYVREAEERPLAARPSYFKLALSHFDQVPFKQQRFNEERHNVAQHLQALSQLLINTSNFDELDVYCRILLDWQAEEQMAAIGQALVKRTRSALQEADWDAVQECSEALTQKFDSVSWESVLMPDFRDSIFKKLEEGDLDSALELWEVARSMCSDTRSMELSYSEEIRKRILETVEDDDSTLPIVSAYLALWEAVERDGKNRLEFAKSLLNLAGHYWLKRGWETRAFRLMKLAGTLPYLTEKEDFEAHVQSALKVVFQHAANTDNATKLTKLYEAVDYFKLKRSDLQDRQETANQLADAKFLFDEGRFHDAEKRLAVILTLAPEHKEALRLKGLVRYQVKDYEKALEILQESQAKDLAVMEAMGVSHTLAGDPLTGTQMLVAVRQQRAISRDALTRLGLTLLERGQSDSAVQWLSQITSPNWEIKTALSIAHWEIKDWEAALAQYRKLPTVYNRWKGLGLIVSQCLAELGQIEEAEAVLQTAIKRIDPQVPHECSSEFRTLKKAKLDTLNSDQIAGNFYRNHRKDYHRALTFFKELPQDELPVIIAQAEINLLLGNAIEAQKLLETALASGEQSDGHGRASGLLGEVYLQLKHPYKAERAFRQYFLLSDVDAGRRHQYIDLLVSLDKWDLALEQYQQLKVTDELKPKDYPRYITCLWYNDQDRQAKNTLKQRSKEVMSLSPALRLQLAQAAFLTGQPNVITQLLDSTQGIQLDAQAKEELLALYLLLGNHSKAGRLANAEQADLMKSARGRLLLAQWAEGQGKRDDAIKLGEQCLKQDSANAAALELLNRIDPDWRHSEERLSQLRKRLYRDVDEPGSGLAYARQLHAFAKQKYAANDMPEEGFESMLEEVLKRTRRISQSYPDFAAPHLIIANALEELEDLKGAEEAYQKTLSLDRSCSDAYEGLARIAHTNGQLDQQQEYLQKALHYEPFQADVWGTLAESYLNDSDYLPARQALQQAIKYHPNNPAFLVNMAKILMQMQSHHDALVCLQKSVELRPNDEEAACLLLQCLYDELYELDSRNHRTDIDKARHQAFQRLFALDPDLARKQLSECQTRQSIE